MAIIFNYSPDKDYKYISTNLHDGIHGGFSEIEEQMIRIIIYCKKKRNQLRSSLRRLAVNSVPRNVAGIIIQKIARKLLTRLPIPQNNN